MEREQLLYRKEHGKLRKVVQPAPQGPKFANLEITLPCHCSLQFQGITLATPSFPCSKNDEDQMSFLNVAPAQWTKLEEVVLPAPDINSTRPIVANYSDVQDRNWTSGVLSLPKSNYDDLANLKEEDEQLEGPVFNTPITEWFESQMRGDVVGLWICWILNTGAMVGCIVELLQLRVEVNPILAAFAMQGIPAAAAQTFTPTVSFFPVHVEALIILTFVGVIILILPVIYRIAATTYRKLRPPTRTARRPTYRELVEQRSMEAAALAEAPEPGTQESAVFGSTTILIDNPLVQKAGASGSKKK